jgi:amidase
MSDRSAATSFSANPLSRRTFVTAAVGAGLTTVAKSVPVPRRLSSREAAGSVSADGFELEEATLNELQAGMQAGKWTSAGLAERYLARIEALDRQGPSLHAVMEINPDAMASAADLDQERKSKGPRGPLHGIPVLIKDNIDTADRMMTTAGSLALEGSHARRDSFVAERLRAAGAVILGKTNLSEWANFRSSHSTSGWSSRGGQCRNPYALDRNPCGSSSGTGAGVSGNFCAVGVGTETDGSIVCPSSANGIVGIKPTLGLVSRSGIIPIAASQDTAGPMARTVTDAAILLGVLAGVDPRDPATQPAQGHISADYTTFLNPDGLRGARIGVPRKAFFGYHDPTDAVIGQAIEELRRLGATIIDPCNIPHTGEYDAAEFQVLLYEFKSGVNAYLAGLGPDAPVKTLADVIAFNERERARTMPFFGQDTLVDAEKKGPLTEKAYRKALSKCRQLSRTEGLDAVFAKYSIDALVAPTGNPAWPTDLVNGDHFLGSSSTPAAVSGYPSISVPAGAIFGLPVGLSFIGKPWSEGELIRFAFAYEQATKLRLVPTFQTTAVVEVAAEQ